MEGFVGIREAAQFLGVKTSWLYERVRLGKVPSYKVGAFRRFKISELDAWAQTTRNDPLSSKQGRGK
jgi:excisionase family DNA binding protein